MLGISSPGSFPIIVTSHHLMLKIDHFEMLLLPKELCMWPFNLWVWMLRLLVMLLSIQWHFNVQQLVLTPNRMIILRSILRVPFFYCYGYWHKTLCSCFNVGQLTFTTTLWLLAKGRIPNLLWCEDLDQCIGMLM